jgi:16S rRNA (cytosine967-C5)-methyltransferase
MHVTEVSMSKISPARTVAFAVLEQISGGAYASDALREQSGSLDARDAGLASQIVFGSLRFQKQLDYLIELYSGRKINDLDEAVTIALRAGIFQMRYLERVPAHAAVHESVEFVKQRKRAASGFVNAVLRKVNRREVKWPNEETRLSCPEWLLGRWRAHFGDGPARAIAEAALLEPAAYIRIPPGTAPPEGVFTERTGFAERTGGYGEGAQGAFTERTQPEGVFTERTQVEGCWRLTSSEGRGMRLQDISSQAILPLLDLRAGQSYLDLCAAPGNKTLQALESSLALAVACDISERRIRETPPVCPRVVLDATRPLPFSRRFDRIFIDAPCSGTGTLGRNPEIKWRVQPEDFARSREKQVQIALQGSTLLAPAGKLLYATCSLEREENEDVIAEILARHPALRLEREMWRLPGRDEGDGFHAAVLAL